MRSPRPRAVRGSSGMELTGALEVISKIGSPIALATALLFYFGWVRSDVQARALGFDASVLNLSPQDYVLRSINLLFVPLIVLVVLGLVIGLVHQQVMRQVQTKSVRNAISRAAAVLRLSWLPFLLLGLVLLALSPSIGEVLFPFMITLGVLGTVYGHVLRRRLIGERPKASNRLHLLVVALLALLSFLDTERIARVMGEGFAQYVSSDIGRLVGVTVYSPKRLHITAPGITETRLAGPDSAYGFRYDGLRLLHRSGGRYFLLYDGWTRGRGRVLVIPDDSALRIEFIPAASPR